MNALRPAFARAPLRALRPLAALLLLAFGAAGCGPNAGDLGAALLMVAPLVLGLLALLNLPLAALWRPLRPGLDPALRRVFAVAGVLLVPSVLVAALSPYASAELLFLALWLPGCFALLLDLVLVRVLIALAPARAFLVAPLVALGVGFAPAPILLAQGDRTTDLLDACILTYVYVPYFGAVPAVLFAALLVEVAIRRARPAAPREPGAGA